MRQKHLESCLSSLQREFPDPKIELEQYPTSPQLAASVVFLAWQTYGDIGPDRTVLDLGCGTGMLGIAAAALTQALQEEEQEHEVDDDDEYDESNEDVDGAGGGAVRVCGVDCDAGALAVAVENADIAEVEMEWIQARVRDLSSPVGTGGGGGSGGRGGGARSKGRGGRGRGRGRDGGGRAGRSSTPEARQLILTDDDGVPLQSNCVDTVLTNPPFGTKANNAGMDIRFLRTATRLARRAVYSFHKTSTRPFVLQQASSWNHEATVIAEMKFDLPQTYKFHQKKTANVEVDLIRVVIKEENGGGDDAAADNDKKNSSNDNDEQDETGQRNDEDEDDDDV